MTPLALALAVVLATTTSPAVGQPAPSDSAPLEFHGFRAGAHLQELQTLLRRHGGGALRCDRAKADRRVAECRAVVNAPELGGAVELWVSAVDSVAGVITLSGGVGADQLDRWRQTIERRYGRVDATVQGSQWMMQWVRRGRMLRLTWRAERGEKVASVSLVDGRVLDGWGAGRAR
ncbi:MAG TPA: hypothetical protein VMY76_05350 [Gemmatimonadales bacterium]|nr:hypothetical protein [Gemmatimonadales bacterium]